MYLNGYYAGIVDDFDGLFQRLYLPAGEHEIELRLAGYERFHQKLYVGPGDTFDITHQMQPLGLGDMNEPPAPPRALPPEWTGGMLSRNGDQPASPFGVLAIRVEPADAQIFVDDAAWLGTESSGL